MDRRCGVKRITGERGMQGEQEQGLLVNRGSSADTAAQGQGVQPGITPGGMRGGPTCPGQQQQAQMVVVDLGVEEEGGRRAASGGKEAAATETSAATHAGLAMVATEVSEPVYSYSHGPTGRLAAIRLYPVKSCAAQEVQAWPVGPTGLLYDR